MSKRKWMPFFVVVAVLIGLGGQAMASGEPPPPGSIADTLTHSGHQGMPCMGDGMPSADGCGCCGHTDVCEAACTASCVHASLALMSHAVVPATATFEFRASHTTAFSDVIPDVAIPPPQFLS